MVNAGARNFIRNKIQDQIHIHFCQNVEKRQDRIRDKNHVQAIKHLLPSIPTPGKA